MSTDIDTNDTPIKKDVKFCLNCGGMFDKKWNKRFDQAFVDKDFCSGACKKANEKKHRPRTHERPRARKKCVATGYVY